MSDADRSILIEAAKILAAYRNDDPALTEEARSVGNHLSDFIVMEICEPVTA